MSRAALGNVASPPLPVQPEQRQPLTDQEILNEYCATPNIRQFISAFKAGVRYAEAAHNIGAKP